MASGVRGEVYVGDPDVCQIAPASERGEVDSIVRETGGGEAVVEEFTAERDPDIEGMEAVFADGTGTVYRFERPADQGCVCERVERHGCPVRNVEARNGGLEVAFIAADLPELRSVVTDLRGVYSRVAVRRLTQSTPDEGDADLVFVDRSAFTERQREVLRTAHEMGYFEYPKRANAGEVAAELGIATATFTEHLAAAQTKLLSALLDA